MQVLAGIALTPGVNDWLRNSQHPHILHVFDHACNLINEYKDVLSVVTSKIGNGPFNLVVEDDILFSTHLNVESSISIQNHRLSIEDLSINTASAKLWPPRPDWERLHGERNHILNQVTKLPGITYQFSHSLFSALSRADLPSAMIAAKELAGLGQGLTPTGDDIILGSLYAAWILQPPENAKVLAEGIANAAAPWTTSLSAAWLRSAGKGEAGVLWHEFFDALTSTDLLQTHHAINKILAVGETSGADAWTGFISTCLCWKEAGSLYG